MPSSHQSCLVPKCQRYGTTKPLSNHWKKKKQDGLENQDGSPFRQCSADSVFIGFHHLLQHNCQEKTMDICSLSNGFPAFSLKNVIKRLYFCVVLTFEWLLLLWSGVTVLNGSFYFIVRNWFLIFFTESNSTFLCKSDN